MQFWGSLLPVDDFFAPLVLKRYQQTSTQPAQAPLQGSYLGWSITSWGNLFQPVKDIHACEFWMSEQPGRNLFPFPLERVLARAPIMRPPGLLILFLALSFEQGWRCMRKPIDRNVFFCTLLHGKLKRSSRCSRF
jgi:hypothetical protein